MKDESWPMPECLCPNCGHTFTRVSDLKDGTRPEPGDITLCIKCAAVLHFDKTMRVRKLPSLDLLDDKHRKEIAKMQAAIRTVRTTP